MSFNSGQKVGLEAGGTINAHRFVTVGAADLVVIQAAANTDEIVGVAEFDVASGEAATVQIGGVAYVTAGAAVTRGDLLEADATGRGVPSAPGAGVNAFYGAIALETISNADELVRCLVVSGGSQQG